MTQTRPEKSLHALERTSKTLSFYRDADVCDDDMYHGHNESPTQQTK